MARIKAALEWLAGLVAVAAFPVLFLAAVVPIATGRGHVVAFVLYGAFGLFTAWTVFWDFWDRDTAGGRSGTGHGIAVGGGGGGGAGGCGGGGGC